MMAAILYGVWQASKSLIPNQSDRVVFGQLAAGLIVVIAAIALALLV
jgi:hypothetical protein